ncbi:MAG: hypothetical protein QM679_07565 [Patulibacter sp.]
MSTLYLRGVPLEVERELNEIAAASGTSKNRAALVALRRGLGLDQFDRAATIAALRRSRPSVGNVEVAEVIRGERPGA